MLLICILLGIPLYLLIGALLVEEDLKDIKNPIWKLPAVVFFPITVTISFVKLLIEVFVDWIFDVCDYYNIKSFRSKNCRRKHGTPVEITRLGRLVDTGMRKEITTAYRCPVCGREWKETTYV